MFSGKSLQIPFFFYVRDLSAKITHLMMLIYFLYFRNIVLLLFRTTSPEALTHATQVLQFALDKALSWIIGLKPGSSPFHLLLVSLPVKFGGLGIPNPADASSFLYLSSLVASMPLQCSAYSGLNVWDHLLEEKIKKHRGPASDYGFSFFPVLC